MACVDAEQNRRQKSLQPESNTSIFSTFAHNICGPCLVLNIVMNCVFKSVSLLLLLDWVCFSVNLDARNSIV